MQPFHTNQEIDKGEVFIEGLQLINAEGLIELEGQHLATPNLKKNGSKQQSSLGLKPLERGWGGMFRMDLQQTHLADQGEHSEVGPRDCGSRSGCNRKHTAPRKVYSWQTIWTLITRFQEMQGPETHPHGFNPMNPECRTFYRTNDLVSSIKTSIKKGKRDW